MPINKLLAAFVATAALALPAQASASTLYQYFSGGMYPEGGTECGTCDYFHIASSMARPDNGNRYQTLLRFNDGHVGRTYSTAASLAYFATTAEQSTISNPGCYRSSTAGGGGSGYNTGVVCNGRRNP